MKPYLFIAFVSFSILIAVALMIGPTPTLAASPWCKKGERIRSKSATFVVKGAVTSGRFKGKCILNTTSGKITTDLYVDQKALTAIKIPSAKDAGSGCAVFSIKDTRARTELCFGGM